MGRSAAAKQERNSCDFGSQGVSAIQTMTHCPRLDLELGSKHNVKRKRCACPAMGIGQSGPLSAHQQIVHPLSLPALYGQMSRLLVELSRHPDFSPWRISLKCGLWDLPRPAAHSSAPPPLRRRCWTPPPSSSLPPNPAREPRPGMEVQRRYPEALRRPPSRLPGSLMPRPVA